MCVGKSTFAFFMKEIDCDTIYYISVDSKFQKENISFLSADFNRYSIFYEIFYQGLNPLFRFLKK
jgi:hypothetical protein